MTAGTVPLRIREPHSPELEPAPHQKTNCQGFLTGKALGTVHAKGLQGSSELEPVQLGEGWLIVSLATNRRTTRVPGAHQDPAPSWGPAPSIPLCEVCGHMQAY